MNWYFYWFNFGGKISGFIWFGFVEGENAMESKKMVEKQIVEKELSVIVEMTLRMENELNQITSELK